MKKDPDDAPDYLVIVSTLLVLGALGFVVYLLHPLLGDCMP